MPSGPGTRGPRKENAAICSLGVGRPASTGAEPFVSRPRGRSSRARSRRSRARGRRRRSSRRRSPGSGGAPSRWPARRPGSAACEGAPQLPATARRHAAAAVSRRLLRRLRRHRTLALLARDRPQGARSLHLLRQRRLPARRGVAASLPAAAAFARRFRHLVRAPGRQSIGAPGGRGHPPADRGRLPRGKRDRHPLQRPLLRPVPKRRHGLDGT